MSRSATYRFQSDSSTDSPRCWFTGIVLARPRSGGPAQATIEHLVPASQNPFVLHGERVCEANKVWASHLVNGLVADAPLSVKVEIRDALKLYMAGRTSFAENDVKTIRAIVAAILGAWCVDEIPAWVGNLRVLRGLRTLGDDQDPQTRLLRELQMREVHAFVDVFGHLDDAPEALPPRRKKRRRRRGRHAAAPVVQAAAA